ncbi:MAG: response regulator [Chloroflexi bacterium]|nr:response regulator [Chloroflexota bacterium]
MRQGPILVVEDVPNILELIEITLRFKGYSVISAHNGVEALEAIEKTTPALIITDILMPRMDGFAFIQKLRTSDLDRLAIPVIFLSATYVTPEDKNFAMSLGATCFIEKPIDTEEFLLTIAEIMLEDPAAAQKPLNAKEFYQGYRERLEQKLRHKNTQIIRTERLIPTLPTEQRPAFQAMLQQALNDRQTIHDELAEIYNTLDKLKETGK